MGRHMMPSMQVTKGGLVVVDDPELQDGMRATWPTSAVLKHIHHAVTRFGITQVAAWAHPPTLPHTLPLPHIATLTHPPTLPHTPTLTHTATLTHSHSDTHSHTTATPILPCTAYPGRAWPGVCLCLCRSLLCACAGPTHLCCTCACVC